MSEPTPESADLWIDRFIDRFEAFDARLTARAHQDLLLSDKIGLFAIYMKQKA